MACFRQATYHLLSPFLAVAVEYRCVRVRGLQHVEVCPVPLAHIWENIQTAHVVRDVILVRRAVQQTVYNGDYLRTGNKVVSAETAVAVTWRRP